jgi:hypothetical protein
MLFFLTSDVHAIVGGLNEGRRHNSYFSLQLLASLNDVAGVLNCCSWQTYCSSLHCRWRPCFCAVDGVLAVTFGFAVTDVHAAVGILSLFSCMPSYGVISRLWC